MAEDASAALGAQQVAGTLVNPKGMTKKMTASVAGGEVAGVVGNVAASLATGPAYAGAPEVPHFGRVAYWRPTTAKSRSSRPRPARSR